MTIKYLIEMLQRASGDYPVVIWIDYEGNGGGVMAQVSWASPIYYGDESKKYLMLKAYSKDVIRDGKLKLDDLRALPSTPAHLGLSQPQETALPALNPGETSKELAVIDSKGKPGGIIKR